MNRVERHNRKFKRDIHWWAALPFIVLGIVMCAGGADQEVEQDQQDFYCEMVAEGSWPDYKGTYEEHCK